MQANEQLLVQRAKSGDTAAFEQLVLQHQTRIYNLALRMSRSHEDAMDLTQDTFIRIYRALPLFKEESSFSTWAYSIAVNLCRDHMRKEGRRRQVSASEQESQMLAEIPDTRFDPESEFERQELRQAVSDGLDSLTPDHREILVLREMWGMSYAEICEVLELEPGTVKSRISRARCALAVFLRNKLSERKSNKTEGR